MYPTDLLSYAPIGAIILVFLVGGGTVYGFLRSLGILDIIIGSLDGGPDVDIPLDDIEGWTD